MDFTTYVEEQLRLHPATQPQDVIKQCYQAARGAEHLLAHLVEMHPPGLEQAAGMHGECVGIGTIMCASAYHKLAEKETIEVKPFEPVNEQWVRDVFGELADGILKENENDVLKTFAPENIKEKLFPMELFMKLPFDALI